MSDPVGIGLYVVRNLQSQGVRLTVKHVNDPDFESFTESVAEDLGFGDDEGAYDGLPNEELAERLDAAYEADDWRTWFQLQEHLLNRMSETELLINNQADKIASMVLQEMPLKDRYQFGPAVARRAVDFLIGVVDEVNQSAARA